jgi:hypothetical protein
LLACYTCVVWRRERSRTNAPGRTATMRPRNRVTSRHISGSTKPERHARRNAQRHLLLRPPPPPQQQQQPQLLPMSMSRSLPCRRRHEGEAPRRRYRWLRPRRCRCCTQWRPFMECRRRPHRRRASFTMVSLDKHEYPPTLMLFYRPSYCRDWMDLISKA